MNYRMKRLVSVFLCIFPAIFTFAAYTENGKPVTKRNPIIVSKRAEPVSEEQNTKIEGVPSEEETGAQPKESAANETDVKKESVPSENNDDVTSEPAQENAGKEKTEASLPEADLPEPEGNSLPENEVKAIEYPLLAYTEPQPSVEASTPKEQGTSRPVVELKSSNKRNRHAFVLSGFAGIGEVADGIDLAVTGASLEYRYTIGDTRCDSCNLGNRWLFSLRLGYGQGESDDEVYSYWDWYDTYEYDEVSQYSLTVGLSWQHQFSQGVSFILGGFVGGEYFDAGYSVSSRYYDRWYGYYTIEESGEVNGLSLCAGASAVFCFEFGKHHSIEIGAEIYFSDRELEDDEAPGWKNGQLYGLVKIGYGYHF